MEELAAFNRLLVSSTCSSIDFSYLFPRVYFGSKQPLVRLSVLLDMLLEQVDSILELVYDFVRSLLLQLPEKKSTFIY
jgi:hypothetical protein